MFFFLSERGKGKREEKKLTHHERIQGDPGFHRIAKSDV